MTSLLNSDLIITFLWKLWVIWPEISLIDFCLVRRMFTPNGPGVASRLYSVGLARSKNNLN
ncbi:hypothetical protein [Candidatus Endolissoclinum faulkneri]|uniref:hypothetical protein n=1 Tax=Candidatus Endolissoclinum faulkneri TaxID=1263979 RepID=UPI0011D23A10|nr:hypothetical protein [Candidatus Endolissoclinum faulkneri]